MHGTKNTSPIWGFCEWGSDLRRSVKDASYSVTRPGTAFYFVRRDVLAQVLTGAGLRTFRWKVVPSPWTVGREEKGKLTSRQGQMSQMT